MNATLNMKDLLISKDGKNKKLEDKSSYGFMSGFTINDATNLNTGRGLMGEHNVPNGDYGLTSIFGPSNSGKSCMVHQEICSYIDIIKRTKGVNCMFFNLDIEGHTNDARIKQVSGWSDIQLYDHYEQVKGTSDPHEIYNFLRSIAFRIDKDPEKFMMETGAYGLDGNPIRVLVPTFFAIDSAVSIKAKQDFENDKNGEYKEGAMYHNVTGMHTAKAMKNLILNIKELCNKYNFHIYFIEHLKKEIYIDQYAKKNKYLGHLAYGEKLSTDETIYQSNKIVQMATGPMLDPSNDKTNTYGPKVRGFMNRITFVKSKHSREGLKYPMIINTNGFDPVLSDFEFLTEVKYGITGMGTYYLDILPEVKITKKKLLEIVKDNPFVARAIQFTAKSFLHSLYVLEREPDDLKVYQDLPVNDRYALILKHTIDYPRYINRGYSVSEEYRSKAAKSNLDFGIEGSLFNMVSKFIVDMKLRGYVAERELIGYNAVVNKTFDNDKSGHVITTKKGKRFIFGG